MILTLTMEILARASGDPGAKFIIGSHFRYGEETGSGQTASTRDVSVPYVAG
jgi:hypothetical protein